MNILHTKYAVEVARLGSLGKASKTLLVAQPNISRSIRELESDLGITIFNRSAKGMVLTPQGEEFIKYAENILKQINDVELLYKDGARKKQKFSISVPCSAYISEAFANFSKTLTADDAGIFYKETSSHNTIDNLLNHNYKLGILSYSEELDKYFKTILDEKELCYELVAEYVRSVLVSRDSVLASKDEITADDLSGFIEITYAEPEFSSASLSKYEKKKLSGSTNRRIFVMERAAQFDLLSANPQTFMRSSPTPQLLLRRYGLVERKCIDAKRYKDLLIYKDGYFMSELDRRFITELCASKRKYM